MKRLVFLGSIVAIIFLIPFLVSIASTDVAFPVAELGNCESKSACKAYCEIEANFDSCIAFAEKSGLMSKEDAAIARKVKGEGPGGCKGEACKTYCDDEAHAEECLAFAEEHGLLEPSKLQVAREVVKNGGPGGCRNEKQCKEFCSLPENDVQCLAFAEKHDLIPREELEMAKKMVGKSGPGGCRGEACKTYCENPDHMEECITFARDNGLMSDEEYERAKKFSGTTGPGGCRGAACKTYCEDPNHIEECVAFAEANGMMTAEEARRARIPGPGGCRGPACKTYCDESSHQEECMQWAVDNGVVSPEEAERFKNKVPLRPGAEPLPCRGEECRVFCENPENREACSRAYGPENDQPDLNRPEPGYEGRDGGFERRERVLPCASNEECRRLEETCRANPASCNRNFGPDAEQFLHMSEEERQRIMEEHGVPEGEVRDSDGRNPYRPEGVPPPEAYRRPPEGWNGELNPEDMMSGQRYPTDNFNPENAAPMPEGEFAPPPPGDSDTDAPQSRVKPIKIIANILSAFGLSEE